MVLFYSRHAHKLGQSVKEILENFMTKGFKLDQVLGFLW